jgi:hypothetical protein
MCAVMSLLQIQNAKLKKEMAAKVKVGNFLILAIKCDTTKIKTRMCAVLLT